MNDYTGFEPADTRRDLARYKAPRPSWDVPAGGSRVGGGASLGGGTYAPTGDPILDSIRNTTMADAAARSRGARFSAQSAAPNDPSLAAYAGLEGLIQGQGDAARALNVGATNRLREIDARRFQEYMARLEHQWREEEQRKAARAALYGQLGQIPGIAIGSLLA